MDLCFPRVFNVKNHLGCPQLCVNLTLMSGLLFLSSLNILIFWLISGGDRELHLPRQEVE